MLAPRLRSFLTFTAIVCAYTSSAHSSVKVFAQSQTSSASERSAGIALYEKGDNVAAVKALKAAVKRNKADLGAWHYLGLAFERQGKTSDALKAHEKAARLGDDLLEARFLKMDCGNSKSLWEDIHEPLSHAAESAEKCIALSAKLSRSKREQWNARVESLRYFAELSDPKNTASGQSQIFSGKEVNTKAHVLSKPEPMYTEEARTNQVTGTIVLRAIFGADGKVRGIRPVKALPDGLTEMAIKAARQIRFVPATRDGKPVSMYITLEYNFHLY